MDETSDTLLVKLRDPGNQDAWDRFMQLYTPALYGWARGRKFPDADAADVVQDVLLRVARSFPTFEHRGGGSFRAWLGTIFSNVCRDRIKSRVRRPQAGDGGLSGVADGHDAVAELEEGEYARELVRSAVAIIKKDFDGRTWEAFAGVKLEGRPVAEVAADLGMQPGTVHKACSRVLQKLRGQLADLLD